MANFLSVLLPWILTIPFYTGSGFSQVVTWTGVVVNGMVNFIFPLHIYNIAVQRYERIDNDGNDLPTLIDDAVPEEYFPWVDPITLFVRWLKVKLIFGYNAKVMISYFIMMLFILMLLTVIALDAYYLAIGDSIV